MEYMAIMTSECVGVGFVLLIFISIFVCLSGFKGRSYCCSLYQIFSVQCKDCKVILYSLHQIDTFSGFFSLKKYRNVPL